MRKARIIKADSRNFAVQELRTIEPKAKKGEQAPLPRTEWVDQGYYGHRLDHAARFAISASFEDGETITPELVEKAVETIVGETKKVLQ